MSAEPTSERVREELRTQGRGITGALLILGLGMSFTMETWWLSWQLPVGHLALVSGAGLVAVFLLIRATGFRQGFDGDVPLSRLVTDFGELVLQSFVAAYVTLLAFGVIDLDDSLSTVVRLGLVQVVPFGFGAALANRLLTEVDAPIEEEAFPHNLVVFTIGAVFVTFPLAPTDEIVLVASIAGWPRLAALVVLSVAVVHLVLHELEFRGHSDRIEDRRHLLQLGNAVTAYAVGAVVGAVLLFGVGQFEGRSLPELVQMVIVVSFPGATGASAGEVVL
jgi:putative integral membrane protein (TIGR02587 family)